MYRECFKKCTTQNHSFKNLIRPLKTVFLFSVLIVIVHACPLREGHMLVFFNVKEKLLLFDKKGPMIQTLRIRNIRLALNALGTRGTHEFFGPVDL